MSLFEDDFYSIKTPKTRGRNNKSLDQYRWLGDKKLSMLFISGLSGAILMLLIVLVVSLGKGGHPNAGAAAVPAMATSDVQQMNSDAVVGIADKIKPAVVSVLSTKKETKDEVHGVGIGSGVIFQKSGDKARVVTNNHVVDGGTLFEIVTSAGEKKKATLVGKDQVTDLAVLEIDGAGIKTIAEFGDSDALRAGETVIALGNPLGLGFSPTVTRGIISSPKRTVPVSLGHDGGYMDWEMELIQTDAAINQGNSGGALVNLQGKVIGINSLKIADMGVEGLGFAIPVNGVKPIIESLIMNHKVKRPLMGVSTQELQSFNGTDVLKLPADVKNGVIVLEVSGPAKEAGLKSQDVITDLDGKKIGSTIALRKFLYGEKKIGDKVNVTYYRAGKKNSVNVTLVEAGDK